VCSGIHATKYSGGNANFVKMIKNAGAGRQLLFFILAGKELSISVYKHVN